MNAVEPADRWSFSMVMPRWHHLLAFFAAYFVAGGLGQGLAIIPGVSITFWPPAGIFVGVLLLSRKRTWAWFVFAGCLAELTCNVVWFRNPVPSALVYFGANAAEALTAAALIRHFAPRPFRLDSLEQVAAFVLLGAGVAPVVGATLIAATDAALGRHAFQTAWPLVWLGDSTGLLVSAPLTYVVLQGWSERARYTPARILEAVGIFALIFAFGSLAYFGSVSMAFLMLPPTIWAAARFHLRGAAIGLALVTLITAVLAVSGRGELSATHDVLKDRVVLLQSFLGVTAASALIVGAVAVQRQQAIAKLEAVNAELESRVAERTADLATSQDELMRERALLSAALITGKMGIYDWTIGEEVAWWSPETHLIFGTSQGTPVTIDFVNSRLHPEDKDELWEQTYKSIESGEVMSKEYRIIRPNGEVRWLRNVSHVAKDDEGRAVRLTGVAMDIHDQFLAREELRESRERLSFSLQAASAGSWEWHVPTDTIRWSDENYRLFGIAPSVEALGHSDWADFVHPEDRPAAVQAVQDVLHGKARELRAEYRIVLPDGSLRWIMSLGRVDRSPDGEPLRMSGINVDVSDRKRAEEALRDADRRKDEFLATLAHELRNPLAPIRSGLELLKMDVGPVIQEETRTVMSRQLDHLVRLVDDLLDISRLQSGKITLRLERLSLQSAIEAAIETCRSAIQVKDQTIEIDAPVTPVEIEGDTTRIVQVVSNLVGNASKFTPAGGTIRVILSGEGHVAKIFIQDNGIGIDPAQIEGLWEMFTQVRDSDRTQGGLGIGLSLVKRLVEMHGGQVSAFSEGPGTGSTFEIRLPLLAPHETVISDMTCEIDTKVMPRKVLIIDDNRDVAEILSLLLEKNGHRTAIAYSGQDALELARSFAPDAVLCDIGLPGMDGFEVARRLRSDPATAHMLLVAITGWGTDDDKRESRAAGFDWHLTKPVDSSAVAEALSQLDRGAHSGIVKGFLAP